MASKDYAQKSSIQKNRKSGYNSNRDCYLSLDGKHYYYRYYDAFLDSLVTKELEVGKDLSEELAQFLDSTDHDMDLNDRYEHELRDPGFEAKMNDYNADADNAVNPWDTIADMNSSPEETLLSEPEPEEPQVVVIRRVIELECTIEQQNLFFDHFGMGTTLEAIRQAEVAKTGKPLSHNAIPNRKTKIIDKSAKALGVERIKRNKKAKKG